jgi:molybdenum cofactor biosynthesis enzyme MoaA
MEINKEYELLAKFTGELTNLLQHDVVAVSGRLLEKGLVTKNVHDSMLTTEGVSSQKNAARLMSCVLDRVKCSSRCFHEFISVLREDAYFEDIVVKILGVHSKYVWGSSQ